MSAGALGTPLAREALGRRQPRFERRDPHADFVRTLACCSCGRLPRVRPRGHEGKWRTGIEASHIAVSRNEKDAELRDEQRVPLCDGLPRASCRRQWNGRLGKFAGWTDEQRYGLGAVWVRATWVAWANSLARTV